VLDRRETDPGPKEEDRHPERADAERLQIEKRRPFLGDWISWDGSRSREEAKARLEMLAAALGTPPRSADGDRCGKRADDGGRGPFLALFDDRRERDEGGPCARRRPLAPERHLIERALAEPAKPAMKRRVVRGVFAGLVSHRRPQTLSPAEVRSAMVLDVPEREWLAGKRIAGQDAPPRTADVALGEGEREDQALSVFIDQGPGDEGPRDAEGGGAAAFAFNRLQTQLDQLPLLVVDCVRQFDMVWG
jgi:hypothetical protein